VRPLSAPPQRRFVRPRRRRSLLTSSSSAPSSSTDGGGHITITAITASSIATVAIGAAMAIIHTATITAICRKLFIF